MSIFTPDIVIPISLAAGVAAIFFCNIMSARKPRTVASIVGNLQTTATTLVDHAETKAAEAVEHTATIEELAALKADAETEAAKAKVVAQNIATLIGAHA